MNSNQKTLRLSVSNRGLRIWGIIFLAFGMIGRAVFQNRYLNVNSLEDAQLLMESIQLDPNLLQHATIAVLMRGLEAMAAPIFAMLLVEGFRYTSNYKAYLKRVAIMAVACEIPFNLTTGGLLDLGTRNPVFALLFSLVMLAFFNNYSDNSLKSILVKLSVVAGASAWALLLRVQEGLLIILLVAVLYMFMDRKKLQVVFGILVCVACTMYSGYYLATPLGVLMLLLYTGERNAEENRMVNYLAYPVLLTAVGIISRFM